MDSKEISRRASERARLKRKAFKGIGDSDVVAMLDHHRIIDPRQLTIEEERTDIDNKVYYVAKNQGSEEVVELGTEVNSIDEGYDYAIAIVDKSSGEAVFRPARLFKFESRHKSDINQAVGARRRDGSNFADDFSIKSDQFAEKRSLLTENFGSSKKIKFLEATQRRNIDNSTLEQMVKTAFASTTSLEDKKDISIDQISLLKQATSSVLPTPVHTAIPKDIYPISQFLTEEEILNFSADCEAFLADLKQLVADNDDPFPSNVLSLEAFRMKPAGAVAVACVLLIGLVKLSRALGPKGRTLHKKKLLERFNIPTCIVNKLEVDFVDCGNGANLKKLKGSYEVYDLSLDQKQRIVSHCLALSLTLGNCMIPLTPWTEALHSAPITMEKVLSALGCDIMMCSPEDSLRYNSLRIARLSKPPTEKKAMRRRR